MLQSEMPQEGSPRSITDDMAADNRGEPQAKKRRVFLQTMGQQLREVGILQGSPGESVTNTSSSIGDASHAQPLNETPGRDRTQTRQVQIQTPDGDSVPGEDDLLPTGTSMGASRNLWLPNEVISVYPDDGSGAFTFEDLLGWTRSYFDHWHPAYPFLHAPSMLEYFEEIAQHRGSHETDISSYQFTILRSLVSISLADRRQTGTEMRPVPTQLVFASFNDAIHSVQRVLTDETSMLSLQALISVQIFLVSMLRYTAASRLGGLAVRMAFHLGLNRCPVQLSTFSKQEAELRQRVFWSAYCIDRSICIRLGIPLGVRDADVHTCLPTAERHGAATYENPG